MVKELTAGNVGGSEIKSLKWVLAAEKEIKKKEWSDEEVGIGEGRIDERFEGDILRGRNKKSACIDGASGGLIVRHIRADTGHWPLFVLTHWCDVVVDEIKIRRKKLFFSFF